MTFKQQELSLEDQIEREVPVPIPARLYPLFMKWYEETQPNDYCKLIKRLDNESKRINDKLDTISTQVGMKSSGYGERILDHIDALAEKVSNLSISSIPAPAPKVEYTGDAIMRHPILTQQIEKTKFCEAPRTNGVLQKIFIRHGCLYIGDILTKNEKAYKDDKDKGKYGKNYSEIMHNFFAPYGLEFGSLPKDWHYQLDMGVLPACSQQSS